MTRAYCNRAGVSAGQSFTAAGFRLGFGALALVIFSAACSRPQTKAQPERFAVLRFENLSADASADWMGRAFAEIITAELASATPVSSVSSPQIHGFGRQFGIRPISAPGVSAERTEALAAGANRLAAGEYWISGGQLRARMWVEDPLTGKNTNVISVSAPVSSLIGAASTLARGLAPNAQPYYTQNIAALQGYSQALEGRDSGERAEQLQKAIAADANFGPAYRLLAELQAGPNRAAAEVTLTQALAHSAAMAPLEKAQIQLQAAILRGDRAAEQLALAEMVKLDARNPAEWQTLGQLAMSRHDYPQALLAYRALAELTPTDVSALNQLAYATAYAGNVDEGEAAMARYRALRPKDANGWDSAGDINLIVGRLKQAENDYAQATKLDPTFQANCDLFKAAMARLMTGDIAGADQFEQQYEAARTAANDPDAGLRRASWLWISGRKTEAYGQAEALARSAEQKDNRADVSRAYAQLALWSLMKGDRQASEKLSAKASQLAVQATGAGALIAHFLAQPSASPAEWASRAEQFVRSPAQASLKDMMLAYALLLDGKASAAAAPLQRIYDATGLATDEGLAVLLAWSRIEGGKAPEAAALLKWNPVPPTTGVGGFAPLYFPRIFELRAKTMGGSGEGQRNEALFRKLSSGH